MAVASPKGLLTDILPSSHELSTPRPEGLGQNDHLMISLLPFKPFMVTTACTENEIQNPLHDPSSPWSCSPGPLPVLQTLWSPLGNWAGQVPPDSKPTKTPRKGQRLDCVSLGVQGVVSDPKAFLLFDRYGSATSKQRAGHDRLLIMESFD